MATKCQKAYRSVNALMMAEQILSFSTAKNGNSPGATIFEEKCCKTSATQSLLFCVAPLTAAKSKGPAARVTEVCKMHPTRKTKLWHQSRKEFPVHAVQAKTKVIRCFLWMRETTKEMADSTVHEEQLHLK